MNPETNKKNSLTSNLILLMAVIGVIYFGYQVVSDKENGSQENPFEYNIENYKKTDPALLHYEQVRKIKLEFEKVFALGLDYKERIIVSGDSLIDIMDFNGKRFNRIRTGMPATALAIDNQGQIIAATGNSIHIYHDDGRKMHTWDVPAANPILTSLAVHSTGIYAADAENKTVWKFDRGGNLLYQIGPDNKADDVPAFVIPTPYFDVAVDPDGFVWVANPGNHSIENYTPSGSYRTSWGSYSMNIEGFCGCCNPSHLAILNDGSFVTSEKGIPRVKVYNRLGQLQSVVAGPEQFDEDVVGLDLAVDSNNRIFVLIPKEKAVLVYQKKENQTISINKGS